MENKEKINNVVVVLTTEQILKLKQKLQESFWEFTEYPYAYWKAKKEKVNVIAFSSGKVMVQGKGTGEFIEFVLQPEFMNVEKSKINNSNHNDAFIPHIGIDESGKGDYLGPLVIASCYVDQQTAPLLKECGVVDSKLIKSDKKILLVAEKIKEITQGNYNIVAIGNEAYNALYERCQNLNHLLAWGHARTLENLLEKTPQCTLAISDQFGSKGTVKKALMERGKKITLEEHPRAEADVAVAAASILARSEFVNRMKLLEEKYHRPFPKGANAQVEATAKMLVEDFGDDILISCVKKHFKTTEKILTKNEK